MLMREANFLDSLDSNIYVDYLSMKMIQNEKYLNCRVYFLLRSKFFYKMYLHLSSYEKIMIFQKHVAVGSTGLLLSKSVAAKNQRFVRRFLEEHNMKWRWCKQVLTVAGCLSG
jgi:hypothetical protein